MTTAEVLREARRLYEANPSHSSDDVPEGQLCILMATEEARTRLRAPFETEREADRALSAAVRPRCGLVNWNAEHTTEEVLAAFDKAIEAVS